jgi:diguanylate cyclase (GGDEF)-like protein/hemerythrin-like metal-binding protein
MTTPLTPSESSGQNGADILESFMLFPAPLALLNLEGKLEVINERFADRLGRAEIDPQSLAAIALDADNGWHALPPPPVVKDPGLLARAVRMPHQILVIVERPSAEHPPGTFDVLLSRIDELEQIVATDHLTGAWNRAHLDRVLPTEIARSLSYRQPLSLLLLDIDHLKLINDTLGPPVGDLVLRELVQLVKSRIRASDLLFRWGGEGFMVLIGSTGYRHAGTMAETLCRAIAAHSFGQAGAVTVSIGVAEHNANEPADLWIRRVDAALHAAKQAGRNRIVVDRTGNSDAWAAEHGTSALRLVWQEGYECGNKTIDSEHRELFDLANALIDASLATPFEPAAFKSALATLLNQVQRHFADEEEILKLYCYAQLDEHRRSHASLLERARRFQKIAETDEFNMSDMIEFLAQDVIARHMRIVDRGFFPLFAKATG